MEILNNKKMLQERLNKIKDYFQSMEIMEGKWVLCVRYKPNWGAFPSEDNRIQAIPDESTPNVYWYYSEDKNCDIEEILNLIDETIQTNLEAIKKVELFKLKGEELKRLFSDENVTFAQLQTLKFVMDNDSALSKKSKTRQKNNKNGKITSKKDLLKINSVDIEEEKSQEVPASTASETCEVEVPNVIKTNEVVVNATELSQAEIDDLRG